MTDEFTPNAKPFKFPELTAEAREICAGDSSRGSVKIPDVLLDSTPQGMRKADWVGLVDTGEQFRRMPGGQAKAELATRMMDQGATKSRG